MTIRNETNVDLPGLDWQLTNSWSACNLDRDSFNTAQQLSQGRYICSLNANTLNTKHIIYYKKRQFEHVKITMSDTKLRANQSEKYCCKFRGNVLSIRSQIYLTINCLFEIWFPKFEKQIVTKQLHLYMGDSL